MKDRFESTLLAGWLLLLSPFPGIAESDLSNWVYVEIDNENVKWGDYAEPGWLRYFGVDMGDLNNDGLKDIVSGRTAYMNPGADVTDTWRKIDLGANVDGILVLDVDGDAYADIIAQALPDVYWLEAANREATAWNATKIGKIPSTSHVNSQGFEKAQIIAGGKLEFVIAGDGDIYCFQIPDKPGEHNWDITLVAENTSDEGIGTADIDGDGDIDIAAGRRPEGGNEPLIIVWYKNPGDGSGFWESHVVGRTNHPADRIEVADLDGDNKADIIVAEERYPGKEPDGNLFWFKQPEDPDNEWTRNWIVTQYSMNNLDIADMDKDGDIDLLTAEHKGPDLELQLCVNDGKGVLTKTILDTGKESHLGTQLADMDNDGDLDIVSIGWDQYPFVHLWINNNEDLSMKTWERPEFKATAASYEGRPHYKIETPAITYWYDIRGGGFSRIIDNEGNDWVSFKMEPWDQYPASAASAFRGLPNMVFEGTDGGAGHPGHDKCTSWIEKNKVVTESLSGNWKWSWEFFGDHAVLDVLSVDSTRAYWFLYEGTPGGEFNPEATYFGTSNSGPEKLTYDYYSGNLYKDSFRWIYTGTDNSANTFYIVQVTEDESPDMASLLGNTEKRFESPDGMTVFGFGRGEGVNRYLTGRNKFVIGMFPKPIANPADHQELKTFINEQYLRK